jgi:HAD superfamily hydrolase (TIGR01450 family)
MELAELAGFAFDLDGCIWLGDRLLPGAAELVEALRASGRRVVFVTNSSREVSPDVACRLERLGIGVPAGDVLTALDLLGETIRRRLGAVRVLALGGDRMAETLEAAGHAVVGTAGWARAHAVAVGYDPAFDITRLRAAARAVAGGAAFFAVNLDPRLPLDGGEFDPGCGALAEAVAVAAGVRPFVVGKPYRPIFEIALERLGCRPGEAAMVGDSLASDIAGGRAMGMYTVWLDPSGEEDGGGGADLVVRSLEELRDVWSRARAWREATGRPGRQVGAPPLGGPVRGA